MTQGGWNCSLGSDPMAVLKAKSALTVSGKKGEHCSRRYIQLASRRQGGGMVAKKMLLRPLSESSERPPIIRRTAACARAVSHSSIEVPVCTISKER